MLLSAQRGFARALCLGVACLSCAGPAACAKTGASPATIPGFHLKVIRSYPHDTRAFTQGLLFLDGKLYESTGLHGRSSVRRVDLESGLVEHESKLPSELFGEGLARVGQRLIQLTWKNRKALVWDLGSLAFETELPYEGEGWGLCFDGRQLVMSDGSDKLYRRNPSSFAKEGELAVRLGGRPLRNLNELECIGDAVYANVWQDNHIARIDARSGVVSAWIDASGLLDAREAASADVLNGIAELPSGHLLVTGKLWPRAYEVAVVPGPRVDR